MLLTWGSQPMVEVSYFTVQLSFNDHGYNQFNIFWCAPFGYLYFLIFYNEPELCVGIDPGMALTPLPSSIGQGSNPRPSDCEL